MGHLPGEPATAAVLLLSEIPDRDAWEVAYLGLTPSARGRGLGRAVLAHALELAAAHVPRLELAVDVRNHPATRLYRIDRLRPLRPARRPPCVARRTVGPGVLNGFA